MPLGYNPQDKIEGGSGKAQPGVYDFIVDECSEETFRSGNQGLKVKLLVAALETRDVTVFDRFVYVPKALWKLEQFMASVGVDFNNPCEAHEIERRCGRASCVVGEKGYLEVEEYLPAMANNGPDTRKSAMQAAKPAMASGGGEHDYGPPPYTDEDAPPF